MGIMSTMVLCTGFDIDTNDTAHRSELSIDVEANRSLKNQYTSHNRYIPRRRTWFGRTMYQSGCVVFTLKAMAESLVFETVRLALQSAVLDSEKESTSEGFIWKDISLSTQVMALTTRLVLV